MSSAKKKKRTKVAAVKDNQKEKLTKKQKKQARLDKKAAKKARIAAMSPKERKKRTLKIVCITVLCIITFLVILYFAGKLILEWFLKKEPVVQVDEAYNTYNFYAVPDDKNVWSEINLTEITEYINNKSYETEDELKTDLLVKYPVLEKYPDDYASKLAVYSTLSYKPMFSSPSFGGTFLLEDIPSELRNEGHRFFEKYFKMLHTGNYKLYPSLFSDKYKKNLTGFEKNVNREFPPQMVYDIKITEKARVTDQVIDGKNCIISLYEVSYLIYKNDGMFRSDIGRDIDLNTDVARPLFFELITYDAGKDSEKTYINNLYTESSIMAQAESK